jgi:hypothetical protein
LVSVRNLPPVATARSRRIDREAAPAGAADPMSDN